MTPSRMGLTRGVVGLAALAASCAQPLKNCFEKYQCVFHHDVGGQEYSWDLHQLCHEDADYLNDDGLGHTTYFKICGNASQTSAPGYPTYDTHGVVVQLFGDAPPCNATSPKDCMDYDYNIPTCCTGQSYVLGTEFFRFSLLDESNPGMGVKLIHAGMPSIAQDPFKCPPNPTTLLDTERSVTITILCDSSVNSSDFVVDAMTENQSCAYNIIGRSAAACATKNDPFDCPSLSTSNSNSNSASQSAPPSNTRTATQSASHSRAPPAPPAQAQGNIPAGYISGGATFGVALASAIIAGGLTLLIYVVGESRAWWGSLKKSLPASWSGTGSFASSSTKMTYTSVGSSYGAT